VNAPTEYLEAKCDLKTRWCRPWYWRWWWHELTSSISYNISIYAPRWLNLHHRERVYFCAQCGKWTDWWKCEDCGAWYCSEHADYETEYEDYGGRTYEVPVCPFCC